MSFNNESCSESLTLQAYFDGELDAGGALALERHLAGCAICAAQLKDLESVRAMIRREATYHRASWRSRECAADRDLFEPDQPRPRCVLNPLPRNPHRAAGDPFARPFPARHRNNCARSSKARLEAHCPETSQRAEMHEEMRPELCLARQTHRVTGSAPRCTRRSAAAR